MSQAAQSHRTEEDEDERLRLTTLAAQAAATAERYRELGIKKTDADRYLVGLLNSLNQTVNHPEDNPTELIPLNSIVTMLPDALANATKGQTDARAQKVLAEIEVIVTALSEMI